MWVMWLMGLLLIYHVLTVLICNKNTDVWSWSTKVLSDGEFHFINWTRDSTIPMSGPCTGHLPVDTYCRNISELNIRLLRNTYCLGNEICFLSSTFYPMLFIILDHERVLLLHVLSDSPGLYIFSLLTVIIAVLSFEDKELICL